jgi:hypothetical protein
MQINAKSYVFNDIQMENVNINVANDINNNEVALE